MDAARSLKANKKIEGKPCGWCQTPLALGEDASVCTACEGEHHAACWSTKGGCANASCVNKPIKQLDPPTPGAVEAARQAASGLSNCPRCNNVISIGTQICPLCKAITTPDGIYHGPKTTPKDATNALVAAIVGLFFCGIVLGPIAISKANSAKRQIKEDPSLGGEGTATAALVIAIVDIVAWALIMISKASS